MAFSVYHEAIIWTNGDILTTRHLEINSESINEILLSENIIENIVYNVGHFVQVSLY